MLSNGPYPTDHILEFDNGYKGWDASIANLHNSEVSTIYATSIRWLTLYSQEYNDLKTRTFPLVKERSSNLAQEFSFWPTKPPASTLALLIYFIA